MEYFLFYVGPSIVFFIQLMLCIKCSNKFVKLIPTVLLAVALGVCVFVYLTSTNNHIFFGNQLVAFVYGLLIVITLFVDAVAWGFYLMYKYVKKHEETEGCE